MRKLAAAVVLAYLTTTVIPAVVQAAPGQPQQGGPGQVQPKPDENKKPPEKQGEKKPQHPNDNKKPPQGNGHDDKKPPKPGDDKKQPQKNKYPLCGFKNCGYTGDHKHNNKWYSGHYNGDGHNWHNWQKNNKPGNQPGGPDKHNPPKNHGGEGDGKN